MTLGNYYVYITTNPGKTVLYTGVTNNLQRRLSEHYKNKGNKKSFVGRYYCYKLIYYEHYPDINQAILREKEIKNMSRKKKEQLISTGNPKWSFIII
ncbi:GIY-YIG nuclease family protein [Calditrichota bacterium]